MGIVQIIGTDTYQIDATAGIVAKLGVGIAPTARLTLAAGTTNAGTAPLKLTTGAALASIEDGAMEYHSSHLYFSIGAARFQLDQQSGGALTSPVLINSAALGGIVNGDLEYDNSNLYFCIGAVRYLVTLVAA